MIVLLKENGTITVDGAEVREREISTLLQQKKRQAGITALLLRVERGCLYGPFTRLTSRIRLSGFPRFSIKGVE